MQNQPNNLHKTNLLDKAKWRELIAEWEKSNESQKQFCHRLGLNINTFSYMRGQLTSNNKKVVKERKFIPITLTEVSKESEKFDLLTLENHNGIKLQIPLSITPEKLLQLLQLIGWTHA